MLQLIAQMSGQYVYLALLLTDNVYEYIVFVRNNIEQF